MSALKIFRSPRSALMAGLGVGFVGMVIFLRTSPHPWKGLAAKAAKSEKPYELEEYIQVGLWGSGLGVAVLLGALLVTMRWWWKWTECQPRPAASSARILRWEWLTVALAMIAGAALRLPLADQGILFDEHDNLRRNFHGYTEVGADGVTEKWKPAGYREALFENVRGNNPFLFSVLSHASIDLWRAFTDAPRDRFNPVAMRIPALVVGIGGLLAAWWLARRLGGVGVGLLALWLLALHPLHVRYSGEARGYSIVLLLAPVFLLCCINVLQTGSWRAAIGTSLSAAGLLYAFPGAVYFVAVGALVLATSLLWRHTEISRPTLARLVVAGSLTLGLLVFLMAPAIMQAAAALESQFGRTGRGAPWYVQTWHWMSLGIHMPADQEYYDLRDGRASWPGFFAEALQKQPVTVLMSMVIIPILTMSAAVKWWRQGGGHRVVLIITIGGPLLCLLHHGLITRYDIFQWYMIYALPPFMILVAAGLVLLCKPTATILKVIGPVVLVGVFWYANHGPVHPPQGLPTQWAIDPNLPTARTRFERGPNIWETSRDGKVLLLKALKKPKENPPH